MKTDFGLSFGTFQKKKRDLTHIKRNIKIPLLIGFLFILNSCTNGVTEEDINKIATNPMIKAQVTSIINNNCYTINKSTDGINTYYDVKVYGCNSWSVRNTSEGVMLIKPVDGDMITTSTTTTSMSTTTIPREPIDIDEIPKNKTWEYLGYEGRN